MNVHIHVTLDGEEGESMRRLIEAGLIGDIDKAVQRVIQPGARITLAEAYEATFTAYRVREALVAEMNPQTWVERGTSASVAESCVEITRRKIERTDLAIDALEGIRDAMERAMAEIAR